MDSEDEDEVLLCACLKTRGSGRAVETGSVRAPELRIADTVVRSNSMNGSVDNTGYAVEPRGINPYKPDFSIFFFLNQCILCRS